MRSARRRGMEFGLFVQAHVPRHEVEADPGGAEHARLLREIELAEASDRHGFKYVWSVEHHFLEEYSHLSASEIVLPFIAARTTRIHVGSAIWNLTPPVNHPARVAERVAMLDHLSEGRFEFGTGRGSSSTEFKGFGIPDGDTTRAMFDEALREILRMWRETPYGYEGRFFSMPPRNVLPKPGTPEWPRLLPEPDAATLEERIQAGNRLVGDPDEVAHGVQLYADVGCDQLIFGLLASRQPQEVALHTLELFGREVLPRFDQDALHSTTRMRAAARP